MWSHFVRQYPFPNTLTLNREVSKKKKLVSLSVRLYDKDPENRAKDFSDFLHECSLLYGQKTCTAVFPGKIRIIQKFTMLGQKRPFFNFERILTENRGKEFSESPIL